MFRWADKIKGFEGNQINLGYNKLLVDRTNKTLLMVGNQKREVLDYDLESGIATVDFPFETSIPTEFIINPPEIMIWHTAVYSTPVQSPE